MAIAKLRSKKFLRLLMVLVLATMTILIALHDESSLMTLRQSAWTNSNVGSSFGYQGKDMGVIGTSSHHNPTSMSKNGGQKNIKTGNLSKILPKKVYSVIGLESSGTQFVTGIIRNALKQRSYREGASPYRAPVLDNLHTQVQHFSLPWGSCCQCREAGGFTPVLDLVLPSQCYRRGNPYDDCGKIARDLWGVPQEGSNTVRFPPRFNLDIVSHKEWYDSHGVEQYFIIVMRDPSISRTARFKGHCSNETLLAIEEEAGTKIMIDAINRYILETDDVEKMVTPETYPYWQSQFRQEERRRLSSSLWPFPSSSLQSSFFIPNKNKVVLVSYETLNLLKETYVKVLLQALGIEVDPNIPLLPIKDGNAKYVPGKPQAPGTNMERL